MTTTDSEERLKSELINKPIDKVPALLVITAQCYASRIQGISGQYNIDRRSIAEMALLDAHAIIIAAVKALK
jgi:hypothetical protein